MKTYLHDLAYKVHRAWQEDHDNIYIPLWFVSGISIFSLGLALTSFGYVFGWIILVVSLIIAVSWPVSYEYRRFKEWVRESKTTGEECQ
jgi:hypothetical protein